MYTLSQSVFYRGVGAGMLNQVTSVPDQYSLYHIKQ